MVKLTNKQYETLIAFAEEFADIAKNDRRAYGSRGGYLLQARINNLKKDVAEYNRKDRD